MAQDSTSMVTEAGRKLRAWRRGHKPPLSAHDAGRWLGLSFMSIYRLETGTRSAGGKIMRALLARKICTLDDFETPAPPAEDDLDTPQQCA